MVVLLLGKAVFPAMVPVQAGSREPLELSHPRNTGPKTGSREPGFPPITGAVSKEIINKDGIISCIDLNSKYAMAARMTISLPKRNQEKQWTLEFSLEVYFPWDFFFFFLLACYL